MLSAVVGTAVYITANDDTEKKLLEDANVLAGDYNDYGFSDYATVSPEITWSKQALEYPEWVETGMYEYIEYEKNPFKTETSEIDGEEVRMLFYMPKDVMGSTVMKVTAYQPDELSSASTSGIWSSDLQVFKDLIAIGNTSVGFSGGIIAAIAGGAGQDDSAEMMNEEVRKNCSYYGDDYYTGLPSDGFYTMDSIEITIEN